jgi:ribulose-5-phosphate 4-epimerase/fuculose-1-phosphate aldolase
VALTLQGAWSEEDVLPPITPYYVMRVGHVPLVPYHRPGDLRTADAVVETIRRFATRAPIRAVLMDRLGPCVWHQAPAAAMAVLEELEETARVWITSACRPRPLDDEQIDELRREFGARW